MTRRSWLRILMVCTIGFLVTVGIWTTAKAQSPEPTQLAQATAAPQRKALFGDLHVHTSYSLDSYFGSNPNDPRDAYRFAQGGEVTLATKQKHRLKTPLDFTAVTDHAEFLGEIEICARDPKAPGYNSENCKKLRGAQESPEGAADAFGTFVVGRQDIGVCGPNRELCKETYTPRLWQDIQAAGKEFNQPGKFTTLNAYEWTSKGSITSGAGGGIHRNIIFRNDKVPASVFSATDSPNPEKLWEWLDTNCTGECEAIVIPHNANLSFGTAFAPTYYDGKIPMDANRAKTQQRLERLVEVMQTKGDSECKPGLGNTDELCGFEKLDRRPVSGGKGSNFLIEGAAVQAATTAPICDANNQPQGCVSKYSYIREGLKEGLRQEAKLGINPFKHGFVGGTDTHNGTPASGEEDNYEGNHGISDGTPELRLGIEQSPVADEGLSNVLNNPGGVTGVWAEENTREAIFASLKRRETFATSGPHIQVRLFGGYNFPADLNHRSDMIAQAYRSGVPMGSDLPTAPNAKTAPQFLVWATKDPKSANIHGIQIIKGYLDKSGNPQEKVYAVACSNGLQPKANGLCPLNGAQVDLTTCSYSKNVGAAELSAIWRDPNFDPSQRAFYYARVIENPTCRWSTYDAITLKVDPPDDIKPTIRERAWSSPIWYSPGHA